MTRGPLWATCSLLLMSLPSVVLSQEGSAQESAEPQPGQPDEQQRPGAGAPVPTGVQAAQPPDDSTASELDGHTGQQASSANPSLVDEARQMDEQPGPGAGAPVPARVQVARPTDARTPRDLDEEAGQAEERTAFNSLFLELLGPGDLFSVNYDRVLGDVFSLRVGFSFINTSASSAYLSTASSMRVPLMVSFLGVGGLSHMFEIGLGPVFQISSHSVNSYGFRESKGSVSVGAAGIIGYRYSEYDGGFFFRVGLSPTVADGGFSPLWPYLSLGATI